MNSETVLIVDEDANAAIIAAHLLRLRGFRACVVADAAAAEGRIRNDDVAVVLVGLDRPEAAGLECLRRVRAAIDAAHAGFDASPAPRVIALSRRHQPEVDHFARRMGADMLLRRPVDPPELIRAVEYFAAHRTPARRRA